MHGLDSGLFINHHSPFGQQDHRSLSGPTSLLSVPLQKHQWEGFWINSQIFKDTQGKPCTKANTAKVLHLCMELYLLHHAGEMQLGCFIHSVIISRCLEHNHCNLLMSMSATYEIGSSCTAYPCGIY